MRNGFKKIGRLIVSLSLIRALGLLQALVLLIKLVLLVDDRKECIARPSEVPAASLFEAFDDSTATLLDYADVALADREVLPLDV